MEPRHLAPVISRLPKPKTSEGRDRGWVGENCEAFQAGTTPSTLLIDVIGFQNNGCTTCADYDDQYEIPQSSTPCVWDLPQDIGTCQNFGSTAINHIRAFTTKSAGASPVKSIVVQFFSFGVDWYAWGFTSAPGPLWNGETLDLMLSYRRNDLLANCISTSSLVRVRAKLD